MLIRWGAAVFALAQLFNYYLPFPPGIFEISLALIGALAVGNFAISVAIRRITTPKASRRLSLAAIVLDSAVVLGLVFAYTFDPDTAVWAMIYLLPVEAAIRFETRGAAAMMLVSAVVYTLREVYGAARFGHDLLVTSITFRMGIGVLLTAICGQLATGLGKQRRRAEEALAKERRVALTLQSVSSAADHAHTLEEAAKVSLEQVCVLSGWAAGHLLVRAPGEPAELISSGIWYFGGSENFGKLRQTTEAMSFPPGVGLPGKVLATREPIWVADANSHPDFKRAQLCPDLGVGAVFAFPVISDDEVVAVLEFFSVEPRRRDEEFLQVMSHVGYQLARVVDRTRAEAAVRESEEAIRAARDRALEASRLKSQFLANTSHEIRTPMNGVLGMAQLLSQTPMNSVQRDYLSALIESGVSLLKIIDDILDFSKVEAGKLEMESVDFHLPALLGGLQDLTSSAARNKNLDCRLEIDPDVPEWFCGDPIRLRQILTNLTSNAVKFTDEGGVVTRVLSGQEGRVRFEVVDTGIGIDPEDRERLLDPFSQADASTTRRFGGSGLGLSISRQLVELMGGEMDFHSEKGRGSTFWFEVPLKAVAAPEPTGGSRAAPGGTVTGSAGRVLVVEDSKINQLVAQGMLQNLGYDVDIRANGAEAVEAVRNNAYVAVLMDCLMPVMDGYEATRTIRREEGPARHTPIVALTAAAMTGDREKCLLAGMDDFVPKPIEFKALAEALSRVRIPDTGGR